MATIDEIFNSMPEVAAEGDHEYLVIDPVNRTISVPESERIFAVVGDEVADRKYFLCPRYVGDGLDLAGMFLTVYFRNAGGDEDGCLVKDLAVVGDYVTFSWLLSEKVAAYKGAIQFSVCADLPNTAEKKRPDWNTTMASGEVLEGLHPALGDVEAETSDVVTQLREEIAASTAAVEAAGAAQVDAVEAAGAAATADARAQIEAKGAATLSTIPADYTTLANKTNEQANAIKGHLAGEIVQAGDVSPVEHFLGVKVSGKNLIPFPYEQMSQTAQGGTFTAQADGGVTGTGTPQDFVGVHLCHNVRVGKGQAFTLSCSGDAANIAAQLSVTSAGGETLRTISVKCGELYTYTPTTDVIVGALVKRSTAGVEMSGTIYVQLELGTEATEYTPYIDPAGVTVTRCGKNLLPYPYNGTVYSNGVTFTENADGSITLNGSNNGESNSVFYITKDKYTAIAAGEYTGNLGADGVALMGVIKGGGYKTLSSYFKLSESIELRSIYLQITKGSAVVFDNLKVYPQLELGAAATAYETPTRSETMPDETGTVTGLPSLAPNMTLLTDTAGVKIECTYNRDSNAVYAELLDKIAALSGTI